MYSKALDIRVHHPHTERAFISWLWFSIIFSLQFLHCTNIKYTRYIQHIIMYYFILKNRKNKKKKKTMEKCFLAFPSGYSEQENFSARKSVSRKNKNLHFSTPPSPPFLLLLLFSLTLNLLECNMELKIHKYPGPYGEISLPC